MGDIFIIVGVGLVASLFCIIYFAISAKKRKSTVNKTLSDCLPPKESKFGIDYEKLSEQANPAVYGKKSNEQARKSGIAAIASVTEHVVGKTGGDS